MYTVEYQYNWSTESNKEIFMDMLSAYEAYNKLVESKSVKWVVIKKKAEVIAERKELNS